MNSSSQGLDPQGFLMYFNEKGFEETVSLRRVAFVGEVGQGRCVILTTDGQVILAKDELRELIQQVKEFSALGLQYSLTVVLSGVIVERDDIAQEPEGGASAQLAQEAYRYFGPFKSKDIN